MSPYRLGQSTNDIQRNVVPSLLVPSLPYMGVHMMAEGAIVSHGPVPMCPWLIRCCSGLSDRGDRKSSTSGESISRKLSALGVVSGDGTEVRKGNTYEQGESRRG
jgi:hypothetical protein